MAGLAGATLLAGGGLAPTALAITPAATRASVRDVPTQVLLEMTGPTGDYYCGGTVLSSTSVATAAHCLFDSAGTAFSAPDVSVVAGISAFDPVTFLAAPTPTDAEQDAHAVSLRIHPGYHAAAGGAPRADDVATLEIAPALDLSGPVVQAAALPAPQSDVATGRPLRLSGFGAAAPNGNLGDGALHTGDASAIDAGEIAGSDGAVWLGATGASAICSGDAGGPLTMADGTLVGIVDGATACAAGATVLAANVAAPEIRDFLTGTDTPPAAPRGSGADLVTQGEARPGGAFACLPGSWSGTPTYRYAFFDQASGATLQDGDGAVYSLGDGDVGRRVGCRVTARTAGGHVTVPAPHVITVNPPRPVAPTPVVPSPYAAQLLRFGHNAAGAPRFVLNLTTTRSTAASGTACVTATAAHLKMSTAKAMRRAPNVLCWSLVSVSPGTLISLPFVIDRSLAPGPRNRSVALAATLTTAGAADGTTTATFALRLPRRAVPKSGGSR